VVPSQCPLLGRNGITLCPIGLVQPNNPAVQPVSASRSTKDSLAARPICRESCEARTVLEYAEGNCDGANERACSDSVVRGQSFEIGNRFVRGPNGEHVDVHVGVAICPEPGQSGGGAV